MEDSRKSVNSRRAGDGGMAGWRNGVQVRPKPRRKPWCSLEGVAAVKSLRRLRRREILSAMLIAAAHVPHGPSPPHATVHARRKNSGSETL